jgi:hypothetical protein
MQPKDRTSNYPLRAFPRLGAVPWLACQQTPQAKLVAKASRQRKATCGQSGRICLEAVQQFCCGSAGVVWMPLGTASLSVERGPGSVDVCLDAGQLDITGGDVATLA